MKVPPERRDDARPEHRSAPVVSSYRTLDRGGTDARLRPGYYEGVRPRQSIERLPKTAPWKGRAASERIERIDEDNIQLAGQRPVLETVVQQENVRIETLRKQAAGFVPVPTNSNVHNAGPDKDLRFIARELRRTGCACADDDFVLNRAPPVTVRQNRRLVCVLIEAGGQPCYEGRLPGAAHCHCSHADHRSLELLLAGEAAGPIAPHSRAPNPCQ